MLSSTMRTLMGGTDPSSRPMPDVGWGEEALEDSFFRRRWVLTWLSGVGLRVRFGRRLWGGPPEGVGGCELCWLVGGASGAGGVGSGGAAGTPLG